MRLGNYKLNIFAFALITTFGCGNGVISVINVPEEYATIQEAINAANPGNTIVIAGGFYEESLNIAKDITLQGEGPSATILVADASPLMTINGNVSISGLSLSGSENGIDIRGSSSVVLENSVLSGFTGNALFTEPGAGATVTVKNCHVTNNRDGLGPEDANGTIKNNYIADNTDDGIDLDGDNNLTIENNIIVRNGDDGIEIRPINGVNLLIRSNLFEGNGEDGIEIIESPLGPTDSVMEIRQNVFVGNGRFGIGCVSNETEEADVIFTEDILCSANTFRSSNVGDVSSTCGDCSN